MSDRIFGVIGLIISAIFNKKPGFKAQLTVKATCAKINTDSKYR